MSHPLNRSIPIALIALALALISFPTPATAVDNIAIFQPADKTMRLKNVLEGGTSDEIFKVQGTGSSSQIYPVGGNFEIDEVHGAGYYDRASRTFQLRYAHVTGAPDLSFTFDPLGSGNNMYPIAGDWNGNGVETIGLFYQTTGTFYLRNFNTSGGPSITLTITGVAGSNWLPVAGDWNGDGQDTVGAFDRSTGAFRLRNSNSSGGADVSFTFTGLPSGTFFPIAGDWNSTGVTTVGVYDQSTSRFHLKNSNATGPEDLSFAFGNPSGYLPVAGNWDGDAFRFKVPKGPNGEPILGFAQLVKSPTLSTGEFELYFPAADSFNDSSQQKIMYNVWSGGSWQYDPSLILYNHVPDASIALGSVFIDSNKVFKDPYGVYHKRLMYYVYQPVGSSYAGWVCLSFSDDGINWDPPIKATTNASSPVAACSGDGGIATEAVSGFRRGSTLWMAAMEGDTSALVSGIQNQTDRTYTYLYTADLSNPRVMAKQGEFSKLGIQRPNKGGRYVHGYGINVDFTYDAPAKVLYFSRAYPYSYDSSGGIPCNNPTTTPKCVVGISQLPNRAQIYKLPIPTGRIRDALSGTWQLVEDYGASVGYRDTDTGVCTNGNLVFSYQDPLGLDINSVSFYKENNGRIDSSTLGSRYVVLGAGPKDRVYGNCDFTTRHLYVLPVTF